MALNENIYFNNFSFDLKDPEVLQSILVVNEINDEDIADIDNQGLESFEYYLSTIKHKVSNNFKNNENKENNKIKDKPPYLPPYLPPPEKKDKEEENEKEKEKEKEKKRRKEGQTEGEEEEDNSELINNKNYLLKKIQLYVELIKKLEETINNNDDIDEKYKTLNEEILGMIDDDTIGDRELYKQNITTMYEFFITLIENLQTKILNVIDNR